MKMIKKIIYIPILVIAFLGVNSVSADYDSTYPFNIFSENSEQKIERIDELFVNSDMKKKANKDFINYVIGKGIKDGIPFSQDYGPVRKYFDITYLNKKGITVSDTEIEHIKKLYSIEKDTLGKAIPKICNNSGINKYFSDGKCLSKPAKNSSFLKTDKSSVVGIFWKCNTGYNKSSLGCLPTRAQEIKNNIKKENDIKKENSKFPFNFYLSSKKFHEDIERNDNSYINIKTNTLEFNTLLNQIFNQGRALNINKNAYSLYYQISFTETNRVSATLDEIKGIKELYLIEKDVMKKYVTHDVKKEVIVEKKCKTYYKKSGNNCIFDELSVIEEIKPKVDRLERKINNKMRKNKNKTQIEIKNMYVKIQGIKAKLDSKSLRSTVAIVDYVDFRIKQILIKNNLY